MEHGNQSEAAENYRKAKTWRCMRHVNNGDDVVGVGNAIETTWVATAKDYGQFWHDGERLVGGFAHGPGFKAWAKDFPEGTILYVVAEVFLP